MISCPTLAFSDDSDWVPDDFAILVTSIHVNATDEFEEQNPGLFVGWHGDIADTRAGCFINSYGGQSCAITWSTADFGVVLGPVDVKPFLGLAYYGEDAVKMGPANLGAGYIAIGGLEFTSDGIPLFMQALPGNGETTDFVLAAGLWF